MRIKKALVLSDFQIPYHCKDSIKLVEKYMADNRFDYYILLGDFLDFFSISKYNEGKPGDIEGMRLSDDYLIANEILDKHQRLIRKNSPKCKFVFIYGNHCARLDKYLAANPQLKGLIEVENGLHLNERGFKQVFSYPKGEVYKLGKLYFHHGLYTGAHHAKKMVDNFGQSIVYGHTHTLQTATKIRFETKETQIGQSLGCLCEYEQSYIGKNPKEWVKAFGVVYLHPGGDFNLYPIVINGSKFISPEGILYSI